MRAWWNSLTSNNRHANGKKSPYNPSFTSIRTGLTSDSVSNIAKETGYSSYPVSSPSASQTNLSTGYTSQFPGLLRRDTGPSQGMLMQDFQEGVAPPPPVADSWRRIDEWTEDNYPELYDQLSYGATEADIDELENAIEMHLPSDVRESFFVHDGQERGGRPTGLFFGIALLDCEELVDEYGLWKKVASQLPRPNEYPQYSSATGPSNGSIANSRRGSNTTTQSTATRRPKPQQPKQSSRPEGAIQCVYAHPGWIPLAKDYVGNNIAIDLAPGPKGRVGQVILFGRDCDVKYVIAPSWSAFLAAFVSDLESDNVIVDEDVGVGGEMGQLRYVVDLENPDQEYSYMETLKARVRRRDRALRGNMNDGASSTSSVNTYGLMKKNGKGRASSPLKHERLPRSNLGMETNNMSRDLLTGPTAINSIVIDKKEQLSADASSDTANESAETVTPSSADRSNEPIQVSNSVAPPLESIPLGKEPATTLDTEDLRDENVTMTKA